MGHEQDEYSDLDTAKETSEFNDKSDMGVDDCDKKSDGRSGSWGAVGDGRCRCCWRRMESGEANAVEAVRSDQTVHTRVMMYAEILYVV